MFRNVQWSAEIQNNERVFEFRNPRPKSQTQNSDPVIWILGCLWITSSAEPDILTIWIKCNDYTIYTFLIKPIFVQSCETKVDYRFIYVLEHGRQQSTLPRYTISLHNTDCNLDHIVLLQIKFDLWLHGFVTYHYGFVVYHMWISCWFSSHKMWLWLDTFLKITQMSISV